jgi:hypothetical protein
MQNNSNIGGEDAQKVENPGINMILIRGKLSEIMEFAMTFDTSKTKYDCFIYI